MSQGVTFVDHAIRTEGGYVAGFLVRATASRRDLGYVWRGPKLWHWRGPDGSLYREGIASSRETAVENLWDDGEANGRVWSRPPLDAAVTAAMAAPTYRPPVQAQRVPAKAARPEPPAVPAPKIDWDAAVGIDLTAAVGAALGRNR